MMRKFGGLLLTAVIVGCGGYQPVNLTGPAAAPQALTCVREQFTTLGYEVRTPAPGPNVVTGIRVNEPPWYKRVLGFRSTVNEITATASGGELAVTAFSTDAANPVEGGRAVDADRANEHTARDARQIIGACTQRA